MAIAKKTTLRRPIAPMPARVKAALVDEDLMEAYRSRPPYQRNDYLRWIAGAKREATREKRIGVLVAELRDGKKYMNMPWSGEKGRN